MPVKAWRNSAPAIVVEVNMLNSEFLLNQRPDVGDAHAARAWLRELPLTDTRAAHHALESLLDAFDDNALSLRKRLDILETVRAQRVEIDAQYARRYVDKPLPLAEAERAACTHALSLWQKLETCYWQCACAAAAGDGTLRPHLALCLARAADLACERIKGALRAGQALDGSAAAALAQYASSARVHGVLDTAVPDSLHPKHGVTVASVQQRALLLSLAGAGGGLLPGRERECAFELATVWETKLAVNWMLSGLTRALTREDLPPAADPARQRIRIVHQGGQIYFMDVTALSRSLRKRIHLLGLGKGTGELKLPASFPASGADKLLTRLHGLWCAEDFGRRTPRTTLAALPATLLMPAPGTADLTVAPCSAAGAFDAMVCLIQGEPFTANEEAGTTSRSRFNEMFVFQGGGHMRRDRQVSEAQQQFESWRSLDHSAGGARIGRAHGASARCKPGQLFALRSTARSTARSTDSTAQLAELRWCAEQPAGAAGTASAANVLEAGIELLAPAPTAVAVRLTGINATGAQRWTAAFLCGGVAAGRVLITPQGWYKPGRTIEILIGKETQRWLLGPLKRRGIDFEMIEVARTP